MTRSFSSRITVYFGALFLLAVSALFAIWYFGLPWIARSGAHDMRLGVVMRELEFSADTQRALILRELGEARGDSLVLADSRALARQLEKSDPELQKDFRAAFDSWQRAYPDRYQELLVVDPNSGRIRAASVDGEIGHVFSEPGLIRRMIKPGINELVEQIDIGGTASIAILRQIRAPGSRSGGQGNLVGILVAYLNPQNFVGFRAGNDQDLARSRGTILLFDAAGRRIASSTADVQGVRPFRPDPRVTEGFEGTLTEVDAGGREQLVVYRHLQLTGASAWRLVHLTDKEAALSELRTRARSLAAAALLFAFAALALVSLAARRVTRPLHLLARAAGKLGTGDFSVRATFRGRDSREIITLAEAFNGMAENLQKVHEMLEARVQERTAALQRSEMRHRTLFESTADAVLIIAPSGLIDCNPAAVRMFGATRREDLIGRHPADLSPTVQGSGRDSRQEADRNVVRMRREGHVHFEWIHRRLDTGENFVTEVVLNPLDINEQPLVQATVRDINARKLAEEQLARQKSVLHTIVENFPGGISMCDAELRVVISNSRFATLLEFPDELVHRDNLMLEDLIRYNAERGEYGAGDVGEIVAASLARARRFEAHKFERTRPNGTILSVRGVPLPGGGFVTFYIDITERKLAEKVLRESEGMFRAVAQSANDAIVTADESGSIIKWNTGAENIFGLAEAEAVGQQLTCLMPERFRAAHQAGMQRVAAGGNPHVMGRPVELVGLRKDGSEFPLELSLAQWRVPEGRFFTGVIRDITERKNIERQLADQKNHLEDLVRQRTTELTQALDAARKADQAKDAFLANMSHELRTPLNAVIGMAGLARNIATEPRQRDYLEKIVGAGSHLNRIINDLLDLTKIAAGHMEFEAITFSPDVLLERCRSVMESRVAEKGLHLVLETDPAVPDALVGDPHRVEQILLNLIGNAIKFTQSGGISIRVALAEKREHRVCLRIEVEDTGIGMNAEAQERLFQPFSQADSSISRQYGGSGLGLAISRRLAQMMDGDITVSSREGSGTTFGVSLWFGLGSAAGLPAPAPASAAAEPLLPTAYQGVRLLVAEDQPLNREIVEALLVAVDIVPRMVQNGQEALDMLTAAGPAAFDLVLMDIQMPLMDGLTATRAIRRLSGFEKLPIIAMTAHTMTHEKESSLAAGMNDHIGKPFDNEHFYRTLAHWIPRGKQVLAPAAAEASDRSPVAVAGGLGSLRGVDVAATLARFGGREDRYRHWLLEFVTTSGAIPAQLRNEMASGNQDAAAKTAHAFKGRVGMLGMAGLHAEVIELEQALRNGTATEAAFGRLEQSINDMNQQLTRALAGGTAEDASTPTESGTIVWRDDFNVGVAAMDEQHRRLVDMINQLAGCLTEKGNAAAGKVQQVLSAMFDYTQTHFRDEEVLLQKIGYPQFAAHVEEHEAFVRKMISFNLAATDGVIDVVGVHGYLKGWLLAHILNSDKQYARFVAAGAGRA